MTKRPLIVIDCWLTRGLVCLLNQLCYTGGVHIKTVGKETTISIRSNNNA